LSVLLLQMVDFHIPTHIHYICNVIPDACYTWVHHLVDDIDLGTNHFDLHNKTVVDD